LEKNAEFLGIEADIIFNEKEQNLRWKNFKQLSADQMYEVVSRSDARKNCNQHRCITY
jgi:type I restriction enzyme M protein